MVKTDPETLAAGESIYADLQALGIDVLLDDRDERPGVKFNDAELIGVPYRITIGPRSLAEGEAEFQVRADGSSVNLALGEVAAHAKALVVAAR